MMGSRPAAGRVVGWRREALIFGLAVIAYQAARGLTRGASAAAVGHARDVLGAERALGLAIEGSVQGALGGTPWLTALDWVYLGAQQVMLAVGIVVVYGASRPVYRLLRTTLVITWLLALPVYALFPTAPPRLAGLGIADTVSRSTPIGLAHGPATLVYNPYAAVPSLHAGFAVALGIAVALSTRSRALRLAGFAWGPLVILATVATGNHFVIDVGAGLILTAAGLGLALCLPRISALWARSSERSSGAPAGSRRRLGTSRAAVLR